jgi:hypothetical protein
MPCPICGKQAAPEPASPEGAAMCLSCSLVLWWFGERLVAATDAHPLDLVELLMELEEEFEVTSR